MECPACGIEIDGPERRGPANESVPLCRYCGGTQEEAAESLAGLLRRLRQFGLGHVARPLLRRSHR